MASFEEPNAGGPGWTRILELWDEIKWDIQELYGVDLDDDVQRASRSWHWFLSRMSALISAPVQAYRPDGHPLLRNRLQRALYEKT